MDNKELREQAEHYKSLYEMMERINTLQYETIQTQHNVIMLQDAELKKLKGGEQSDRD